MLYYINFQSINGVVNGTVSGNVYGRINGYVSSLRGTVFQMSNAGNIWINKQTKKISY